MSRTQLDVTNILVWKEFEKAFSYNRQIRYYTDRRRKLNRYANWAILLLTLISAFSFLIEPYLGAIFAALSVIAQVVKTIAPIFQQSESDLIELDKEATFFARYETEMESLYNKLYFGNLHPVFCSEQFFNLKEEASKHLATVSRYFRGIPKKQHDKFQNELNKYARDTYDNEAGESQL